MDYFTSDLHIGHDKDFLYKPRGFDSIEQHDTAIVKRWNDIVTPDDTVYILGDLCMSGNESQWNRVYKALNGHIKFIRGNHDTINKIERYINEYKMEDLGYATPYRYKKWHFYLSHFPTYTANLDDDKKRPLINLFGHTHQRSKFFKNNPFMYNVAIDAHGVPITIEQIIQDIGVINENKNTICQF